MIKALYEIKVLCSDEKIRVYKVCGSNLDIAIQKFQVQFPDAIIITHKFLHYYED